MLIIMIHSLAHLKYKSSKFTTYLQLLNVKLTLKLYSKRLFSKSIVNRKFLTGIDKIHSCKQNNSSNY